MDPFSYLTVLVSIILGLGITQLLTGVGRLLGARHRVRWYWPAATWVGLLLLIHIQAWWAMFELRSHATWTFASFFVVLLLPIGLYLSAALALPDFAPEGAIDLRASYFAHAGWFFTLGMVVVLTSFLRPLALGDRRALDWDAGAHAVFLGGMLGAAITRRELYHKAVAIGFAVLLWAYAFVLFAQLR